MKNLMQMGAPQRVSERAFHGNFLNLDCCCDVASKKLHTCLEVKWCNAT